MGKDGEVIYACTYICMYIYYICALYIYAFLEEGIWRWRREYAYVNICDMRVQIVAYVLRREGPEGEDGGHYLYLNMRYYYQRIIK